MKKLIISLTTANARISAFFYFGSFVLNVGNYLFHFLLMRMLRPDIYGEFLSYVSFFYLLTIPASTITTVVSKYVADFYGKKNNDKINNFFYLMLGKVMLPSVVMALLVIVAAPFLAIPLKAHSIAFVVLGVNIITSFFGAIVGAYLLAFQRFVFQVFSGFITVVLKIGLAYFLIKAGFGAIGGILAILIAGVIGILIVLMNIKPDVYPRIKRLKKLEIKIGSFFTYSLILTGGVLSLMSVDVLLVRYFFDTHSSGLYSALSVLGRMIYFGLSPFTMLMLPMVSKRFAEKKRTQPVLWKLGSVAMFFGLIGVGAFSIRPELIVKLLSGVQYVEVSSLLPLFSLSMMMLAMNQLLLMYLMGVNHQRVNLILLVAMLMQPLLIFVFHESIKQVVMINLVLQIGLLMSILVYYKVTLKKVS